MAIRRGSVLLSLLVLLVLVYAAWKFSPVLLRQAGLRLQYTEAPQKADAILVLAGGASGDRIQKATELRKQGYAPVILLSGPISAFGMTECEMSIPYMMRQGEPAAQYQCLSNEGRNTVDEAEALVSRMRERGVRNFILVTSNFHTARARRVYKAAATDMTFTTVGSDPPEFSLPEWWKTREGRKMFLLEWTKTFAHWLHL